MTRMTRKQAIALWEGLVWNRTDDVDCNGEPVEDGAHCVDPRNEHEWGTLAYGFFLALGFSLADAYEMSFSDEVIS